VDAYIDVTFVDIETSGILGSPIPYKLYFLWYAMMRIVDMDLD
jgi:hypothetical protein